MESNIKGESNLGWTDARTFFCAYPNTCMHWGFFSSLLALPYCMLQRLKPLLTSKVVPPLPQCPNEHGGVGSLWMLEITSHFQTLVPLGNESECCIKLSTLGIFSSASMWSTLYLFLSHNQRLKLRIIIAIMWQEGAARRWERRAPAELS